MPHSFTLDKNETATISFSFSGDWPNVIEIRSKLGNHDRGNHADFGGNNPVILTNNGQNQEEVSVAHRYKNAWDGRPWGPSHGRVQIRTLKSGQIIVGFEDQAHGKYENAIADIKITNSHPRD